MLGSLRSFHFALAVISVAAASCGGGGGGGGGIQPPPPQPDFTISVGANPIDISQGSISSPINVSVSPQDGFSSAVSVTFSGLPNGITTSPATPFAVSAGDSVSVLFEASSDANPITATSTSNAQLKVLSPSSAATGAVNLTSYLSNGWLALAPNAFSYGPTILRVSRIKVTLGGKPANVS